MTGHSVTKTPTLPTAQYLPSLTELVLYMDNISSTTTRDRQTLPTLLDTLDTPLMNSVKWKYLVRIFLGSADNNVDIISDVRL